MDALGIEWTLLLAQIVNFAILIVLLRMFLYQPVLNMLNARKDRIAQSMRDAERVSAAAREAEAEKVKVLEVARREAQEIRAQATRDAEKIAQDVRGRAEVEATEKLLGRELEKKSEQQRFVAEFLAQNSGGKGK